MGPASQFATLLNIVTDFTVGYNDTLNTYTCVYLAPLNTQQESLFLCQISYPKHGYYVFPHLFYTQNKDHFLHIPPARVDRYKKILLHHLASQGKHDEGGINGK